jgi:hypothetical protein
LYCECYNNNIACTYKLLLPKKQTSTGSPFDGFASNTPLAAFAGSKIFGKIISFLFSSLYFLKSLLISLCYVFKSPKKIIMIIPLMASMEKRKLLPIPHPLPCKYHQRRCQLPLPMCHGPPQQCERAHVWLISQGTIT